MLQVQSSSSSTRIITPSDHVDSLRASTKFVTHKLYAEKRPVEERESKLNALYIISMVANNVDCFVLTNKQADSCGNCPKHVR